MSAGACTREASLRESFDPAATLRAPIATVQRESARFAGGFPAFRALSSNGQLVTQPKLINQLAVGVEVGALQIGKETLARADHLQEAAAAVVVLGVRAEVIGEVIDPFREQRNLDLRRAGVGVVLAIFFRSPRFLQMPLNSYPKFLSVILL